MESEWRYLLPAPVRRFPADLAVIVGLSLLTVFVVLVPVVRETPVRPILGLPFLLFLPGYALIALLFPEEGTSPVTAPDDELSGGEFEELDDDKESEDENSWFDGVPNQDRGIDGIERVALAFGLSIAVVPLIGLGLNFTPWGITLVPILLTVSGFTILCAVGAAYRRWQLPQDERFRVPYQNWLARARAELFAPADRVDAVLNVLLAVSIVLAVSSLSYAVLFPPDGEQFTEFYLLTEDEDGELVAANYPTDLEVGESTAPIVGIENNEHESVTYTVVVQLQVVDTDGNESEVLEREEINRITTPELAHNETWHHPLEIAPSFEGEDLRVQYLLYRDDPPDSPTVENAYRDIHIWVDVST